MSINVAIPHVIEDEAYNIILSTIRSSAQAGNRVNLMDIIKNFADQHKPKNLSGGMMVYHYDLNQPNAAPFFSAAWRLCMRGILAQTPAHMSYDVGVGAVFFITEFGEKWLNGLSDYDCVPTEYGRFSQLLSTHSKILGDGYHVRSQEAIRCYRVQTYLACCAMCGAAAESIILALAIAKKGDEEAIIKEYGGSGGRGKIERFLLTNQDAHIMKNLPNYTSLLNDWRDVAAHGSAPAVGEEEAFTALMFLLRFARFAVERWDTIINVKKS